MPACGRNARRKCIGVVERAHRRVSAQQSRQRRLEVETFRLRQVRRLLDDAVADDAGKSDTDGVQRSVRAPPPSFPRRSSRQSGLRACSEAGSTPPVVRVDADRTDEPVVLHQTHRDVFHGQHADCTSHRGSCPPRLEPRQLVEPVERRRLVALRQRRVVEDRVRRSSPSCPRTPSPPARCAQLAGALTDDVHAEQSPRLPVEDQLEAARRVAADLPARDLAVVRRARSRTARPRR